jgi:hypothetical protein
MLSTRLVAYCRTALTVWQASPSTQLFLPLDASLAHNYLQRPLNQ